MERVHQMAAAFAIVCFQSAHALARTAELPLVLLAPVPDLWRGVYVHCGASWASTNVWVAIRAFFNDIGRCGSCSAWPEYQIRDCYSLECV